MAADDALRQRLRALFVEELEEGVELLCTRLLAVEDGSPPGADVVTELFRTAHSLKGAAHAATVPEAVAVCERMETALADVRDGAASLDPPLVTALLRDADQLSAVATALRPGAGAAPGRPPHAPAPPAGPSPVAARAVAPPSAAPPSAAPSADVAGSPPPGSSPHGGGPVRLSAARIDTLLDAAARAHVEARRLRRLVVDAGHAAARVEAVREAWRDARDGAAGDDLSGAVAEAADAAWGVLRSAEAAERQLVHSSRELLGAARWLRMQPFSAACSGLDRVVRDVATGSGKQAALRVVGGDVEVDRSVVVALREPLLHLVRNAVDHGIEPVAARRTAGKPPNGTVEVSAALRDGTLHVTVSDDGAGVDTAALREAAAARGQPAAGDELELAFVPGLSTRRTVTSVSGRGVGLDAARARLEQLGGRLRMSSRPGAGTVFELTAPVTLAVMRVLLARADGEVVALPTTAVERVADVPAAALREVGGQTVAQLGGRVVRVVSLSAALGLAGSAAVEPTATLCLVLSWDSDVALLADELVAEVELSVKPPPARAAGAPAVLGVAVLDDGRPAVLVNPLALGRRPGVATIAAAPDRGPAAGRVLLVEDTVTTRALERSILEAAGYQVQVAVDGADAWEQLQGSAVDLVVSDVQMPRMDGIALCRKIRSSAALRDLPFVLVTSLGSDDDRRRGLEAGADAYVSKSELDEGSLVDTVARLL